jgi:hypothetical protein
MEVERAGGVVQSTCASTRMVARCSHFAGVGLQPHGPDPWLALILAQRSLAANRCRPQETTAAITVNNRSVRRACRSCRHNRVMAQFIIIDPIPHSRGPGQTPAGRPLSPPYARPDPVICGRYNTGQTARPIRSPCRSLPTTACRSPKTACRHQTGDHRSPFDAFKSRQIGATLCRHTAPRGF